MKMIKRASPGPNIGTVGSGKGHPKSVGTKGNTTGLSASTSGGQHSFLPAPKESNKTSGGQSSSSGPRSDNLYDFMPRKAGGKK